MKYFANCPAGFQDVAAASLRVDLGGSLRVLLIEDGFLVFECNAPPQRVGELPYLNNVFICLHQEKNIGTKPIEGLIEKVLRVTPSTLLRQALPPQAKSFRVMVRDVGGLVAINKKVRSVFIESVAHATRLQYVSNKADCEYWVIRRRSGYGFLGMRVGTRHKTEKDLQRGELRPEIAHLLCALSEPKETDVFLDPFAGTGAIPFARALLPYNMIFAFDHDENRTKTMKALIKSTAPINRKRNPLIIRREDARALSSINDSFIDKIVTDPPWGIFDGAKSYSSGFYNEILSECIRVTKAGGIIVFLLGNDKEAQRLKEEFSETLECVLFLNVLVAGRKACVLKWRRH